MFSLDPRLASSSEFVAEGPLCQIRLQSDARWPWLVLIPRVSGLREIDELDTPQQRRLVEEVTAAMATVRVLGEVEGRAVEKLNVGALGNIVAQLHVHVVGRRRDDPAWPGPVWGFGQAEARAPERTRTLIALAATRLSSPPR